jgi:hypothetical protein
METHVPPSLRPERLLTVQCLHDRTAINMHLSIVAANMPCLKIFLEGTAYNELYMSLAKLTAV